MKYSSYSVDNDREFLKALNRAKDKVSDLTIPLTLIKKDFYIGQKAIFDLDGPGKYPELKQKTIDFKESKYGDAYPILKASGKLSNSLLDENDPNAISEIVGKDSLFLGTILTYFKYHQQGTKNLEERKALFIGPEAPRFANSRQIGRLNRWKRILEDYVIKQTRISGVAS